MWTRFRSITNKNLSGKPICCGICEQEISYGEDGIEYVKTKRGTEIFVHRDCIKKWG
uniref:RING-variant domain n=1 Tax=Siphoviridae sp. ct9zP9 TaxID=2827795 RepID=A0A8S5SHQ2_9CAUD|nr:MAG TPA: RING-variant domain [Siphoviridae sp. ct9zP9]DAO26745.1 MAG TPA: RING-variant domain [Caudoviricetes sp.]DAO97519.1 MAG TPA: RING-variant domain [Caudoviricetes sp.]